MLYKHTLGYGKFFSADDGTGSGGAQGDAGDEASTGEKGDDTAGEGDDEAGNEGDDGEAPDVDALETSIANLKDTLKKERAAHKAAQRDVKRLESELKAALESADTSDLTAQLAEMEGKWRDAVSRTAVIEAATAAHAVSPKAVYALVRDRVELDEAGAVQNIDALIEGLKADDPALFRSAGGSLDGGTRGGAPRTEPSTPTERLAGAYRQAKK